MNYDLIKAPQKRIKLSRLNLQSDMQVKWMDKMVVVVKCQFLATLTEKLQPFAFINPIEIHEQIEELYKS